MDLNGFMEGILFWKIPSGIPLSMVVSVLEPSLSLRTDVPKAQNDSLEVTMNDASLQYTLIAVKAPLIGAKTTYAFN